MKRLIIIGITILVVGITAFTMINKKEVAGKISEGSVKEYPIDFPLVDKDDQPVDLSEYAGKVVVLNFWASWCRPCAYEMPDLQKFYEANKDRDVEVVAVALDRNFAASKAFMEKNDYTIPYFRPQEYIPSQFPVSAIPVTFVLDKSGNIVTTYRGITDFGGESFLKDIELARK